MNIIEMIVHRFNPADRATNLKATTSYEPISTRIVPRWPSPQNNRERASMKPKPNSMGSAASALPLATPKIDHPTLFTGVFMLGRGRQK